MIALAVDDEKLMLNTLTDAIRESEDISVVYDFTSCQKALDFAKDNYFGYFNAGNGRSGSGKESA